MWLPSAFSRPVSSFQEPVTAPDVEPDEGDQTVMCFNTEWLPFLIGAAKQLLLQTTWNGDADAVLMAQGRANNLIALLGSNALVCPELTVLRGIRYNGETDHVETDFGDTGTWTENDAFDGRTSVIFQYPHRTDDAKRCLSAFGMAAGIKLFVSAGERYFEISTITAAIVDGLVLFIPDIGVFISLIISGGEALLTAGGDALADNFTDTTYQQLADIFFCHVDDNGVLDGTGFSAVKADVISTQSLFVQGICALYFFLTGLVGQNNAGVKYAGVGDCSGADCAWTYVWPFEDSECDWVADPDQGSVAGTWVAANGWGVVDHGGSNGYGHVYEEGIKSPDFDTFSDTVITGVTAYVSISTSEGHNECFIGVTRSTNLHSYWYTNVWSSPIVGTGTISGAHTGLHVGLDMQWNSLPAYYNTITISGTGTKPTFTGGAWL